MLPGEDCCDCGDLSMPFGFVKVGTHFINLSQVRSVKLLPNRAVVTFSPDQVIDMEGASAKELVRVLDVLSMEVDDDEDTGEFTPSPN
jgi:hypothetical protein